MATYIGLLRAVNLGPHNKISMAALRDLIEDAGYADVQTYIQSGNVVFTSTDRSTKRIEATIEAGLAEAGLATPVMVRSGRDLERIVDANPFPQVGPAQLLVVFLKSKAARSGPIDTTRYGPEQAELRAGELFVHYPNGVGRSRLTGTVIDRLVGTVGTGRNWNTVNKLAEMARSG